VLTEQFKGKLQNKQEQRRNQTNAKTRDITKQLLSHNNKISENTIEPAILWCEKYVYTYIQQYCNKQKVPLKYG
jgi:ribosome maturation protein Sdo1